MKTYVKPALEVISVKTSENIAADTFIKSLYTKAAGNSTSYDYEGTKELLYSSNTDELAAEVFAS